MKDGSTTTIWLVERKANLIEEMRRKEEEAVRKEQERLVAMEKAYVNRLLVDATALQQASVIRSYVRDVRAKCAEEKVFVTDEEMEGWATWALSQADRIDPLQSNRFIDSMRDQLKTP